MKADDLRVPGFVEAGACALDTSLKSGVRFTISHHREERVIYAFAVNDVIKYVGVCDSSQTCFAKRMSRYQGMMGAGTNRRIAGHLKKVLSQGSAVRFSYGGHSRTSVSVISAST